MTDDASVAVWAVTPAGARVAAQIAEALDGAQVYCGLSVPDLPDGAIRFDRLAETVAKVFHHYRAHVFVMAVGIAVRMIAGHIRSKAADPAVVAADDAGRFAVSLISGHLGGANQLTVAIAEITGAAPVITTATDNDNVPAIDSLAVSHGLIIENPETVKYVSMAFLTGVPVWRHDPLHLLDDALGEWTSAQRPGGAEGGMGVVVDYRVADLPDQVLVLRPKMLAVGIGCNSGTSAAELKDAVSAVFEDYRLSKHCIRRFATITDKLGEPGLSAMAAQAGCELKGYGRRQLASITDVPNPSMMVHRHMGVKSVCEAAAILGAGKGILVVPKQKMGNVTVAVAAAGSMSWASAPAGSPICPDGPGKPSKPPR